MDNNSVVVPTMRSKFCRRLTSFSYKYEYRLSLKLWLFLVLVSVDHKSGSLGVYSFTTPPNNYLTRHHQNVIHLYRGSDLNLFRQNEVSDNNDMADKKEENSWMTFPQPPSFFGNDDNTSAALSKYDTQKKRKGVSKGDDDIELMERQVIASVNAKLDAQRVQDALLSVEDESNYKRELDDPPSPLSVATAAGTVAFAAMYSLLPNPSLLLSSLGFIAVFAVAMIRYEDADDTNLAGPMARIVGRATISTIKKSQPKVKAVARAVASKEDEFERLVKENAELKEWKRRRMAVDDVFGNYTMQQLKDLARENKVQGFSTMNKSTLMMKLIDVGALNL